MTHHRTSIIMKRVALLATLALVVAPGCAPAEEPTEAHQQAAVDWSPEFQKALDLYSAVSKYYGYANAVFGVYQTLTELSWGDQAARALRLELDGLHADIARIEAHVRNTDKFVDRSVVDAKLTALQAPRGAVKAALDYLGMPEYQAGAEVAAAGAANTMMDWHWYEMPTADGGVRFDPRVGEATFVEAVTAWLALRTANKRPIDGALRTALDGYATRLEELAARTRAVVTCTRGCAVTREPAACVRQPRGIDQTPHECPPPRMVGKGFSTCTDGIARVTENGLPDAPTHCVAQESRESVPARATELVERLYTPQIIEQTAALWRSIAAL